MKLKVLSVGTKSPGWVRDGFAEFAKRMPREMPLELIEIPPGKHHKDANKFKAEEGGHMLAGIRDADWLVALDERGKQCTSQQLAERMQDWRGMGKDVVITIGGSDGLHGSVLARANETMALSKLTLPHYLVRVVLAETLYRAYTITQNHPYHRQ